MSAPSSTTVNKTAHPFERAALEGLAVRRFFYCNAFEIYGGMYSSQCTGSPSS